MVLYLVGDRWTNPAMWYTVSDWFRVRVRVGVWFRATVLLGSIRLVLYSECANYFLEHVYPLQQTAYSYVAAAYPIG